MHNKHWLSTSIMLVVFIAELTSGELAQTHGRSLHVNEQYWITRNPLAARAAAGRAAGSRFAVTVPQFKVVGTCLTFDAPGASNIIRFRSAATAVSASGVISGNYNDVHSFSQGFLRIASGKLVTFDAPGAVNGTSSTGVDNKRAIAVDGLGQACIV